MMSSSPIAPASNGRSTAASPQAALLHEPAPLPPELPLPPRKVIRGWLIPLSQRVVLKPVLLLLFDLTLWLAALAGVVLLPHWAAKLAAALLAGFMIGRIFIIGHDACHQSLTPHRRLNKWLGRIAFLPSLTPYSLWDVGHNLVHHGYTNLKGFDFVWAPLTREEYDKLSPWGRLLDRVYRSGWAPGLYYLIEMWWKRMFFPNRQHMPTRRPVFLLDNLLVSVFALAWIGALIWAAWATGQSVWLLLGLGFILPFLFWCAMIGFVVYVHHTHPKVAWHDERSAWAKA